MMDRGSTLNASRGKAVERGLFTASEAANLSHDDAIDLIFASGLSTAKAVTDISGRGGRHGHRTTITSNN